MYMYTHWSEFTQRKYIAKIDTQHVNTQVYIYTLHPDMLISPLGEVKERERERGREGELTLGVLEVVPP